MSKLKQTSHNELNGYHHLNDLNNNNETEDPLNKMILNQLEFYFSRENLLHDKYLVSQMDNDNYVPISILIHFNMMKKIFSNSSLSEDQERIKFVQELIRSQNSQLQLDSSQTKIRANHKRCVIILREISKETPVEDIVSIFDNCRVKCLNCEFAGSRSWYLTFKDEQEAQIAVQYVKEEVQFYKNEPLFARIKTNPIPRVNSINDTSIDKSENESETKLNYTQYPYYYNYPYDMNQMPLLANPWMIYPPYQNFSKFKNNQTSNETTSSYVIDPFMIPYGAYPPQYKPNYNRKKPKDSDLTSQNEDDDDKRNKRYVNYNQNFILFPLPAPFVYQPPQIPYMTQYAQPIQNTTSSSSSTSSFKNTDKQKQVRNNLNKKYTPRTDNVKNVKYPTKQKQNNQGYRKSRNFNGRKNDAMLPIVQFDYEPTSFPPLNENGEPVEIETVEVDVDSSSPWSNSRRSFAEIVKHKQLNSLVDDMNKVKLNDESA